MSLPLSLVLLSVSDSLACQAFSVFPCPAPTVFPLLSLSHCLLGIPLWLVSLCRSLPGVSCLFSLSPGQASVGPPMEESVAHAVAAVGGRLYISGGFGGVALGRLLALTMPPDPCRLLPSPEACNQSGACTWCHGVCLSGDQAHR